MKMCATISLLSRAHFRIHKQMILRCVLMAIRDVAFVVILIGCLSTPVILALFLLGYFLVYKKCFKGKKRLSPVRATVYILLIVYSLIILCVTLFARTASVTSRIDPYPFSQYRSAWYNFSLQEWRNIVLNIAMFIPIGILIPALYPKFRTLYAIAAICLMSSLLIETIQLITHRGIFATDDVFHNALGGVIGYGLFRFSFVLITKQHKKSVKVILPLIPLILTIFSFCGIYLFYQMKEYGIVTETYINKVNMDNITLSTDVELSDRPNELFIYETSGQATQDQIHTFAKDFFTAADAVLDEESTINHGDTTYFYAKSLTGEKLCLGIRHFAMTFTYEDLSASQYEKVMPSKKDILKQLESLGIQIPESVEFSQSDTLQSRFDVLPNADGSLSMWGYLVCESYSDDTIKYVENEIVPCYPIKPTEVISEQTAYEQIAKGMFRCDFQIPEYCDEMLVKSVRITYCMDTKGYLQPAYCFYIEVEGQKQRIIIPAVPAI